MLKLGDPVELYIGDTNVMSSFITEINGDTCTIKHSGDYNLNTGHALYAKDLRFEKANNGFKQGEKILVTNTDVWVERTFITKYENKYICVDKYGMYDSWDKALRMGG